MANNYKLPLRGNPKSKFNIVILAILATGLIVFLLLVQQGFIFPRSGAAADVKLTLTAGSNELVTTKTVILRVDTLGKPITYANVSLRFDPNIMSLTSAGITPSDKLKNVVVKSTPAEAVNGSINITLAARPEDLEVLPSGSFELARFQVEKKSNVTTNNLSSVMSFDTALTQVVDNTARNLSIEAPALTFKVNPTAGGTPASQPTVAPQPTVKPSATPIATTATTYQVQLKNIPDPNTINDLFMFNSVSFGGRTLQETDSALSFSDKWTATSNSKYTVNTAWVNFVSTASSINLITSRGPSRASRVEVWVNGSLKQVLNLSSTSVEDNYSVSVNLK